MRFLQIILIFILSINILIYIPNMPFPHSLQSQDELLQYTGVNSQYAHIPDKVHITLPLNYSTSDSFM